MCACMCACMCVCFASVSGGCSVLQCVRVGQCRQAERRHPVLAPTSQNTHTHTHTLAHRHRHSVTVHRAFSLLCIFSLVTLKYVQLVLDEKEIAAFSPFSLSNYIIQGLCCFPTLDTQPEQNKYGNLAGP